MLLSGRPTATTARTSTPILCHPPPAASSRVAVMEAAPARIKSPLRSMSIWLKSMPALQNCPLAEPRAVIRLGIVGSNYGRTVQLPAFRADRRCEVVALAGSNAARTTEIARADNIPKAYGDWRALVEDSTVQAVAIATLPSLQAQIAIRALELGKPVFAEKPLASDLAAARAMLRQA